MLKDEGDERVFEVIQKFKDEFDPIEHVLEESKTYQKHLEKMKNKSKKKKNQKRKGNSQFFHNGWILIF